MNATYEPPEDNEKCLEKYGTDLTELAKNGKLTFGKTSVTPSI